MVTELQFAAVAAYLLWCLFSSLSGVLGPDQEDAEPDICETDRNDRIATAG
ncbi:MAG TPA: hypothetical protein VFP27_19620 [Mycobacterium sp.]|jgi:hypothetical protein|nr:hypothetical protein [Mycobacterium sp.]